MSVYHTQGVEPVGNLASILANNSTYNFPRIVDECSTLSNGDTHSALIRAPGHTLRSLSVQLLSLTRHSHAQEKQWVNRDR